MSLRAGQSWQTSLADLSLILFMATAAAVSHQSPRLPVKAPSGPASAAPSPQTEPLSVYVAAPGAPPLAQWLHDQAADPRQQLTITARYGPEGGAQSRALADAEHLLAEAGAQGQAARIVVEPGEGGVRAVLAYDSPYEGQMGRKAGR
ncbi:hypothetical protein [Novosphingobium album (ex Hu et al. 2023)]|uniref:Uncharacterized protein n=1 Tax=Novosphingobium album (ex Hu et al. 2023) TaxID=2930093 RepID=A0ABT0AZP9_9SPHN|nr:hypothetical protein [Novosphingobium album (ex Hu et al. 2023)]MCJ2178235.1 hypothetical protein [Novosphingobium album (ex Hu et al. 2023)]